MKHYLLFLLFLLAQVSVAEEPVKYKTLMKAAKTALKNSSGQDDAEKNLLAALQREDLSNAQRAEIYFTAHELERSKNDAENLKLYLKQSYDTTKFFSTILNMHRYLVACDSVEQSQGSKFVYRNKARQVLTAYRKNLLNGGKYLLRKGNTAEAYPFFDMYLRVVKEPMFEYTLSLKRDTLLPRVAYWATISAYKSGQPRLALEYMDYALAGADSTLRVSLTEYKVNCYEALGDSAQWLETLCDGVRYYPRHDYFYLHLMDYYRNHSKFREGVALSDTLIQQFGERIIYLYGKGHMYLDLGDYDNCITECDKVIAQDSLFTDAYYNKGIAYLNKAIAFGETVCNDIRNPKCKSDRNYLKELYRCAMAPMEKVRALAPDDKKRWAEPLYQIYLNLNLGTKFAEMEAILNEE